MTVTEPVKRHHWMTRVTHWVNAFVLTGMIGSGLQIYGAYPHLGPRESHYPNPFDYTEFPSGMRLGGWLAGGINWHLTLAWPLVVTGLAYVVFLAASGQWRVLLFRPRDVKPALAMTRYYVGRVFRRRREHPPQGKHNALQKGGYSFVVALGALSVATGFAVFKPVQLSLLCALFGGYELARAWHFAAVWLFVGFSIVHVFMVFVVDPRSFPAMLTGWYRGRFPSEG